MDNLGFIHEELDIKILILFILKRLSGPIDNDVLWDVCRTDGGFTYFDYADSLNDLIESKNVAKSEIETYTITSRGIRNADAVETSLPYSVRSKVEELIPQINDLIRRESLIMSKLTEINGEYSVNLGLSDGKGDLFKLSMICSSKSQAINCIKKYRKNPDYFFNKLSDVFLNN